MKTYTKEQIAEALRATFKTNNKLAEILTRLDLLAPAFKAGDRVRIKSCPGSLQGQLGYVYKVVDGSNYLIRCGNGPCWSVHASWLKPAPQFKDGQRVRVKATGQVGRIKAVLADGRILVKGCVSVLQAIELEPAPFKVGDRVRWRLGSNLPWNYGAAEYLSNERVGVRIDGRLVEVAERMLEADPAWWKKWSGANPGLDPAASPLFRVGDRVRRKADGVEGKVNQVKTGGLVNVVLDDGTYLANWEPDKFEMLGPTPTFHVGDRVRWRGTAQTGMVSGVRAFGKLDVELDNGGSLSDYSPDEFELLKLAGPRRFVEDLVSRMDGVVFTHEEAERLRQQIALRTRV
jgi:hypothetical protein